MSDNDYDGEQVIDVGISYRMTNASMEFKLVLNNKMRVWNNLVCGYKSNLETLWILGRSMSANI